MIDLFTVTPTHIDLKFDRTPKLSSLTDDKFTLHQKDIEGTYQPIAIADYLAPINLGEHYNSTSRILRRHIITSFPTGDYRLTVAGVVDVAGRTIPTDSVEFTVSSTNPDEPLPGPVPEDNADEGIVVKENSIIPNAFSFIDTTSSSNQAFRLLGTDPELDTLFLDSDYQNGRITLNFSNRPAVQYLTPEYFRVQRKTLGTSVSRWEKVDARIALDSSKAKVYIYLPSLPIDDTDTTEPVYDTDGRDYYADGYKYRIKVSKEVATSA